MTRNQIKWAAGHDWFIMSQKGSVLVREEIEGRLAKLIWFDDYTELRIWAGY